MNCPSLDILSRHHDDELADDQADALRDHIAQCAGCRAILAELAKQGQLIRSARLAVPTARMQRRWANLAQIQRERSVRRLTGWLTATAASVLVSGLLLPHDPKPVSVPAPGDLEMAAIGIGLDESSSQQQNTAAWIVADLAGGRQQ